MDERSDYGMLEHHHSSAAAGDCCDGATVTAAVNSSLMQLPFVGDTTGQLGIMDPLTLGFGCSSGLHGDYFAMNSLALVHGWHRSMVPNQNSAYSEMFGSYVGADRYWRNLSTPPRASDHFHSPVPGMTHSPWPCPPTPVPCTDGCTLSFYNTPNMYSAYSTYFSLMSSSIRSGYPSYLSQRFPGWIASYHQRQHDSHKAFLLANSAGEGPHGSPEIQSPWDVHWGGSVAGPLHSPGSSCLSATGQLIFGLTIDEGSSSNGNICDEQKPSIKQEPVPSKVKVRDGSGEHKPQDNSRRNQYRSWTHSDISDSEVLPGFSSTKFLKDEKLHSPNECSLDLCNNNNNNANITDNNNLNSNITNESLQFSHDFQSADDILTTEAAAANGTVLADQKPHLRNIHSSEIKVNSLNGTAKSKQWQIDSIYEEMNDESVVSEPATDSYSSQTLPLNDEELAEMKRKDDVLSVASVTSCLRLSDADLLLQMSTCETVEDKMPHTSYTNDLTCSSKMETELQNSLDLSDPVTKENNNLSHFVAQSKVKDQKLFDDPNVDLNPVESSSENLSIIRHSVFFEEISDDGIESSVGNSDDQAHDANASGCIVSACCINLLPALSDAISEQNGCSKKLESDSVSPSLSLTSGSLPVMSLSSASESSALASSTTISLASPKSTASGDFSSLPSTMLKSSIAVKSDASGTFSHSMALTLYMDGSIKHQKTSISAGISSLSSQDIDLTMPLQSMRYQVSHHRQNPLHNGCKVHAPTFLPEVCTLPCNTITTMTISSGLSPDLLRSTLPAKVYGGIVSSKVAVGQRINHSQTKYHGSSTSSVSGASVITSAEVPVKMEKILKCSSDFESVNEIKDTVASGKNLLSSQDGIQDTGISKGLLFSEITQVDVSSGNSFVPLDFSSSKPWSQSFVGCSLSSSFYLFQSTASCSHIDSGYEPFYSSQFTMAELNSVTSVTPALSSSMSTGTLGIRKSPNVTHSQSPCERNQTARTVEQGEVSWSSAVTAVSSLLLGNSRGSVSHWDYNNVPENLSTKPAASDVISGSSEVVVTKQTQMSAVSREGQTLGRLPNNIQESSSGIPVGIARALQRTIPQLAAACSSAVSVLIDSHQSPITAERCKAADIKSKNSQCNDIPSSDVVWGQKQRLLCTKSLVTTVTDTDKQSSWKNDKESGQGIASSSMINPAAAWVGQFPSFHHRALLPYASSTVGHNQSQHLFHPASGYRLVQDPITGQFFFIPVPDISWPKLDNSLFPNAQELCRDRRPSGITENTSLADQSNSVQNDSKIFTGTNQGSGCEAESVSLTENVDVSCVRQFPILFSATRPSYLFCDSQLFIQDPHQPRGQARVCLQSRGTSPVYLQDLESAEEIGRGNRNVLENAESNQGREEFEKTTLNASVQTNHFLLSPLSPERARTAEISIQTSDISDTESLKSVCFIRKRRKHFKSRKQAVLYNQQLASSVSGQSEENSLKSSANGQAQLVIPAANDFVLSDISSDEVDCKSNPVSSCQNCLHQIPFTAAALDGRENNETDSNQLNMATDSCDGNDVLLAPFSQKSVHKVLKTCTHDTVSKYSSSIFYMLQAAAAGLSNCTDNCRKEAEETSFKPESDEGLGNLIILSNIAAAQLPSKSAVAFSQQESKEMGKDNVTSSRKFNIFDLNISQLIESEHSPDVSTGYNVPKSYFFSETEFPSCSKDYTQYGYREQQHTDDFILKILKPDEGPENMDPMELDLRMKMAEVQLKYKQKQRELAKLQRKNKFCNNKAKGKKLKPVPKQTVHRKQSTSKQLCISSDDSSESPTTATDTEEFGQELVKKNTSSKTEPTAAPVHSVGRIKQEFGGIKVSNSRKKISSTLSLGTSAQFQKFPKSPSKIDHKHSGDSWKKKAHKGKPFLMSNQQQELRLTKERARSVSTSIAEECTSGLEMKKCKSEQPKKLDTVAEDVMLKKKPKQFCFYSFKRTKTLVNGKEIRKHKLKMTDAKCGMTDKFKPKVDVVSRKVVDDEWYRRRSERIFLHEASAGSSSSQTVPVTGLRSTGDERSLSAFPSKPFTKPQRTLSQELGLKALSASQKSELSVTLKTCLSENKQASIPRKQASYSSDTDVNSDADDVPLSTLMHKESALELRSCTIKKNELADGLHILYLKCGHFYESRIEAVRPPDIYRVSIDGEHSNRQEIVSQEELLQRAILNISPTTKEQLPDGSRICAYWSQKFCCLYPGTVKNLGKSIDIDDATVYVEFDDGDSGRIPLTHISMLPPSYKIQESESSPPMISVNKKRRNTVAESFGAQPRSSSISRCMSVMDSKSLHLISDHTAFDFSSETKQSCSVRQESSGEKSGTHASNSVEKKSKNEKQEYLCRLKTEIGRERISTDFDLGSVGRKSSQKKVDGINSREKNNYKMSNFAASDQKESNLTFRIKQKLSCGQGTSDSSTDEDDHMMRGRHEGLKSHGQPLKHKKMKLEIMGHPSVSDADETSAIETSRNKCQKRKRRSSHQCMKQNRSSSEIGDQIGAFRPVWEQWQWHGPYTQRPGLKGKAKKQFYRAIRRGSEILKIGDAAVFVSMGQNDLQFVGCIDSLWESWDGNMVVKVKWYYHPEETIGGKRLLEIKSALYQSSHEDENDVQTVSHKCEVLSYTNFKKFQARRYSLNCRPEDVFYLAGTYDPTVSVIAYEQDVPLKSH